MKVKLKKSFTAVIACMMACMMFVTPVFAATTTYSRQTVKLNAMSGGTSRESKVSSGSVLGNDSSITKVELYCNVSRGTDPYTIYVESPSGTTQSVSGPSKSGTIVVSGFEGENPYGTWTIWIKNSGITTNGNMYPVSTVTITLKVTYSYS